MVFPIAPILGAASKANETSGAQTSPNSGGKGMGIKGIVTGVKDKRFFEKQQKANEEAARKAYDESLFNYDRAKDRADLGEDVSLENYGEMTGDYISGDMLTGPGAERFGGGLETLSNMSQGYNPGMAHNPFIGQYGTSVDAVNSLRDSAQGYTDRAVGEWEGALEGVGDEYEAARDQLRGDIDTRKETFTGLLADDREERSDDEASLMLEQWSSEGRSHDRATRAKLIGIYRDQGMSDSEIVQRLQDENPLFSHGLEAYRG